MRYKLCRLVTLLFLVCCSSAGASEEPRIDIHRQQVCPRDATDWCRASSTGGHFEVSLPIPFNDGTIHARDKNGNPITSYVIGTTSPEGVKFSVICMFNPALPMTQAGFEAMAQSFVEGVTVLDNQAVTQGGLSWRQLHVQQKTSSAYIRFTYAHGASYQMIVEYPPAAAAQADLLAPRVFSSFAVTGAPEKP